MRARVFGWAIVPTAAACLLLSACQSSPPPPSPLLTPLPAARHVTPMTPDQRVAAIAIQPADLASTQLRHLMPGGNRVAGQITLDNCGFDFTSEAYRMARREYVVTDEMTGETAIANEVVAYDTPAHAQLALSQWFTAVAHCATTPVHSRVAGTPPITIKVLSVRRNLPEMPVRANVITAERQKAADIGTLYGEAMLQQHGTIVDIVYTSSATATDSVVANQALELALVNGRRLLATEG